MRSKLAAILILNQAKKAGYKEFPIMNARKKETKKPAAVGGVTPKGEDNTKKASDRGAAKDLGFLKAALDLGLSGKTLDEFYIAAQRKLAQESLLDELNRDAGVAPRPATAPATATGPKQVHRIPGGNDHRTRVTKP